MLELLDLSSAAIVGVDETASRRGQHYVTVFPHTQHRLIHFETLFRGTIDSASVYPREVVKRALAHNAAAVILVHNHPSGDPEPSDADRRITQLKDALALIEVRVIDHIVVGIDSCVTLAERGGL